MNANLTDDAPHSHQANWPGPLITAFLILVGLTLCGCSSFNRDWNRSEKIPVPTNSVEGRWEGRWLSHANGHNGALRCIISQTDAEHYDARFRATYMKVLRFSYTVPLVVVQSNGLWHFTGEEDLGSLAGGVYNYEGTATLTNFQSTYRSQYDHGVFELSRPAAD